MIDDEAWAPIDIFDPAIQDELEAAAKVLAKDARFEAEAVLRRHGGFSASTIRTAGDEVEALFMQHYRDTIASVRRRMCH